jgi:hypothetical protein
MTASGRFWTSRGDENPLFQRVFALSVLRSWMLAEIKDWGRWWAVGDLDCPSGPCPDKA